MRLALLALVLVSCTAKVAPPVTSGPTTPSVSPALTSAAALSWRGVADIPTPRSEVAAAVFRGVVYVVGGFGGGNVVETGGEQPLGTFKEVDMFDSAAGKWTRGPDLPTARHGLGVVAVGSALYVMSGGPTPGVSQTAVCEALDVR